MKVNELRVGNWVKVIQSKNGMNTTIQPSSFSVDIENTYKAIPLTQEWLKSFGFERDDLGWYNGIILLGVGKNGFHYLPTEEEHYLLGQELKYVHQLQNLHYAITGDELILNEVI